ncbi:hypothetical protein [Rhodococcus phenolicus]|nr:hypothetical protein [Rhodococcus phenolicus]
MTTLPAPTATHDIATEFGTVRVYEWRSPETAGTVPVVLLRPR